MNPAHKCEQCGAKPQEIIEVTLWQPGRRGLGMSYFCDECAQRFVEKMKCAEKATWN